jgi:hypothetical protein
MTQDLTKLFAAFLQGYDVEKKDAIWTSHSQKFRTFWNDRIIAGGEGELEDPEIDEIVRILDRNGKGNTKDTEAVARVMIPQGAWRRMFNEIKAKKALAKALNDVFHETDAEKTAVAIDKVYALNAGHRNNLTGQSGNAINTMLAAWDPFTNTSVISLKDRKRAIEHFGLDGGPDFEKDAIGRKITLSNAAIVKGFTKLGLNGNVRAISKFLYSPEMKQVWKLEPEEEGPSWDVVKAVPPSATEEIADPALFYMESQLEDFLIENWDKTELGKKYDLIEEKGELISQQYRTEIGIIDILAEDKKSGQLVVIELKKNQTSDDTVGQLTRYMGWLEEHKTDGKLTRGIIIAAQYDNRLHYALKKVKDVEVYLYRVDFKLQEFAKPNK